MNAYEDMLAEWGLSIYDPYGIGLHHRIRRVNKIDSLKEELKAVQADYDEYKAKVECNWNAKTFKDFTDASWNLKACKEELATLMSQ